MIENKVSALLQAAETGQSEGRDLLFVALYGELHRLAQRELGRNAAATLTPTSLLHETFINLAQRDADSFVDRGRFMAYAARAMRGLLIDYLRTRNAQKRGGEFEITSLPTDVPHEELADVEFDRLNEALEILSSVDPRLAECVDLKFFCGMTYEDIGEMWSVSERTVRRDWDKARVLLHRALNGQAIQ